jgi:hypothetical protein
MANMHPTLIVMELVWIITVKPRIDLDDVGVGLIAQELVAGAIKTQDQATLLWLPRGSWCRAGEKLERSLLAIDRRRGRMQTVGFAGPETEARREKEVSGR